MPTKIPWAQETWNPITGCTKISPGCQNCYAERMAQRLKGRFGYPKDEPFRPGVIHEDKMKLPNWRKPRMVFVCSMGDLFHRDVPSQTILDVCGEAEKALKHTFLFLTKRPKRMAEFFADYYCVEPPYDTEPYVDIPKNFWLGVTAENQEQADKRIPVLLKVPAAKRFVSIEPMLGPVDIVRYMGGQTLKCSCGYHDTENELIYQGGNTYECPTCGEWCTPGPALDWAILGCESGTWMKRRHTETDWFRSAIGQAEDAGVPAILKQMEINGKVVKMPYLDGRQWAQFPEVG